jgi:predicted ABC-type ATPase
MKENKIKPVLNMVAGPEGAGKSMIIDKMEKYGWLRDVDYIDLYRVAESEFDGWATATSLRNARHLCDDKVTDALHEGRSMLLECTLSSDDMISLINKAKKAGFYTRVFYIGTSSPRINAARVAQRVMAQGHSASVGDIVTQYSESIAHCCKLARMVNSLYVFDNSVDGENPNLLFHITDGNLGSMSISNLPAWAYPIISPSAF